ncbi:hypothetical protein F5Y09DRAFT_169288 [Xylaria sp. FL1042]|nr:hypothetical protein F5Y09DRAFT_169288 [Xylaria sp. FL1042]
MAASKSSSSSSSPRSVADATRFTSNTPHANTKSAPSAPAAASRSSRSPNVSSSPSLPRRGGGVGAAVGVGASAASSIPHEETMEERVRRLRAAHLAAKQHTVSRMDQIIGGSRRFFDAAHKFTVMGLIGFSSIALLVTVYATADMMMYNRKRRGEFFALQKQLKEDSLEAARLAYMTGTATDEQVALVEDATAKAKEAGIALPPILSAPQAAAPVGGREVPVAEGMVGRSDDDAETQKRGGVTGWLFGGLKKEETRHGDEETLGTGDERWRTTPATPTAAVTATAGEVAGNLRDKAKVAFEQERDVQRRGGPLDQIGIDGTVTTTTTTTATTGSGEGKKKGWLW